MRVEAQPTAFPSAGESPMLLPCDSGGRAEIACIAAATLLAALWFAKVLGSHFSDADGFLAHVCAVAGFERISTLRAYEELAANYRSTHSGWFPLGCLPLAVWLVDLPFALSKTPQYVLIVLNFATFAYVTRRMFRSSSCALLAVTFALCAWQFRAPHDPVIGTSLVTPWLAEPILLAFAAWMSYRDTSKRSRLVVAYALLCAALLTAPLAWGLGAVLTLTMVLASQRRAAFGAAAVIALVVAAAFALGPPDAPWRHPGSYPSNVFAQALAALPTSYRSLGHLQVGHVPSLWHGVRYTDDRFVFVPPVSFPAWIAIVACTLVAYVATSVPRSPSVERTRGEALVFGLGLWLVPALALGSERSWQHGVPLGQAYDAVYFEYLGVGVLATLAVDRVRAFPASTAARLAPSLVALTVFLICVGNVRADAVALQRSARLDDPRSLIQRAGSAGFFAVLPEGSTLAIAPASPFAGGVHSEVSDARYAIFHYTGRRYAVVSQDRLFGPARRSVWLLQTSRDDGTFVSLVHWAGGSGKSALGDRAYGYSPGAQESAAAVDGKHGVAFVERRLQNGKAFVARRLCGPVPVDDVFQASRPALAWGPGFLPLGPTGYDVRLPTQEMTPWGAGYASPGFAKMLMGSRGSLTFVPAACIPSRLRFTGDFVAGGPSTLTIRSGRRVDRVRLTQVPTTIALRYEVRAARPLHVYFTTDAPVADFNPLLFRYERDVPRAVRILVQPSDVAQELAPGNVAARSASRRRR